jgi:replicative DNA helicase
MTSGTVATSEEYGHRLEAAAIGALILNPSAIDAVRGWLTARDFYVPHYRSWFTLICRMRDAGTPVDQITLLTELRGEIPMRLDRHQLAELATIAEQVPIPAAAVSYARAVLDESVRHRLLVTGRHLLQISRCGDVESMFANARRANDDIDADRCRWELAQAPSRALTDRAVSNRPDARQASSGTVRPISATDELGRDL